MLRAGECLEVAILARPLLRAWHTRFERRGRVYRSGRAVGGEVRYEAGDLVLSLLKRGR
jgi:hypothetical protein